MIVETLPIRGQVVSNRLWKHTMEYVDRLARERGISRIAMLSHIVYLGLAVDASNPELVSRIIDEV